MKYLYSLLILGFLSITNVNSQIYEIQKSSAQFDGELRPAWHVTLEPDGKTTSKTFRSYLKDHHDIKLGWLGWKNRDAEEVQWNKVTGNDDNINVYTQFKDIPEGSEFYIAIEVQEGEFMNFQKNDQEMQQVKSVVVHFLSQFLPNYLNDQIEEVNDKISSLDSDLKKARKNYNKNESDIKENEEKIEELKQENYEMKQENVAYQKEIQEKEKQNKSQHTILFEKREKLIKTKEKLTRQMEVE